MNNQIGTLIEKISLDYSIGLGKTIFNSSVAIVPWESYSDTEVILTERFNRIKNSGAWPETPLKLLSSYWKNSKFNICENRDVHSTFEFERYYNERFPFEERLGLLGLEKFSTLKNKIEFLSHHLAHAWSAVSFSPFDECLILVLDGAGSPDELARDQRYEYLSLFEWKGRKLNLLDRKYLSFIPSKIPQQSFSEGIGIFYEKISEYIFNNKTEAGKVMGLAPFGESAGLQESYIQYLESLNWQHHYQGKNKKDWEDSPYMGEYRNLAATVQHNFEHFLFSYLRSVKDRYPNKDQLILTGGCAMNCTFNGKLVKEKLFKKIYIPPNPGDEGIGLGCAFSSFMANNSDNWEPLDWNQLTSSRGAKSSIPQENDIEKKFINYTIEKPLNLAGEIAEILAQGEVIAFIQGRSEIGPRALGNRSILASPRREHLKKYLNAHVKFREDFRPYGCTVLWEKAHLYFDVEIGFENPFMSFAVPVRAEYKETLEDVAHIDGTSRMQTIHREQSRIYYDLLTEMEKRTGLPILLNTSLNVMNEPIVETLDDAKRFFEQSCLKTLVFGEFIISKKN